MTRIPNLILIGFMGTGKSAVGRKCAAMLGYPYHDADAWVVRRARKPIVEIFSADGEAAFRELERDAIRQLCQRSAIVVSTGGGAVLDPENVRMLRESGVVVLLTATVESILSRVTGRSHRPLLQCDDPEARVRELLARREEAYLAAAHTSIDTSDLTPEAAAQVAVGAYRALSGFDAGAPRSPENVL